MDNLLHIFWDPNPVALELGPLKVAWYGITWALGFLFGYYMLSYFFKLEKVPAKWMDSLVLFMVAGSVLGARLGHCLFYEPDYYLSNPLEIIMINKGGMASHGGAIGIILVLWWWSRKIEKRTMLWILDRIVIAVALTGALIRMGNFVNQEIVGSPTNSSFGFVFPKNDQGSEFRAKPDDKGILVSYAKGLNDAANLTLLRSYDGEAFETVASQWRGRSIDKQPWIEMTDAGVKDTCCVTYSLIYKDGVRDTVPGVDSTDNRIAVLEQTVSQRFARLVGQWEGDSLKMMFSWGDPNVTQGGFTIVLLESYDGMNWTKLKSMDLAHGQQTAVLNAAFKPDPNRPVTYRVAYRGASDLHYIARHPAQIYEAVAYFLIFLFLIFLYLRVKGHVPKGQLFGLFLILVFGYRFGIEFLKADQVGFEEGLPINMGQILSIPFILAGLFFLLTSGRRGTDNEPIELEEEKEK